MKQDLNGVRTAQDLERKYNLSGLSTLTKAVELQENSITKTNKTLEDFINVTTDNLKEIGNQEDEIITIWFYEGIPGNTKEPESSWLDYETKNKHKSDLYYDESTGKCYRYTYDDTYKWEEIVDSNVIESLGIANSHKDTEDNKRNIFLTQPIPPYEVGDIWIYKNKLYRCNIGRLDGDTFRNNDWIDATDYSDESASKNTTALLGAYKTLVNTKIITDSLLKIDGESVTIQVNGIDKKVDSKSKVFRTQPTTPYYEGDLYVTQNQVYVCVNKREEGTYISTDWELNVDTSDLVNQSTLTQTATEIRGEVTGVQNQIDDTNTALTELQQASLDYITTETLSSSLDIQKDGILSDVSKEYVTTSDFGTFQQTNETKINQKADATQISAIARTEATNVFGDTASRVDTIEEYFTFDTNGLTIGRSGSEMTMVAQNDKLSFKQGNNETAYFTSNALILKSDNNVQLQIGNFRFVPNSNGSLDFKKV